ncbi:MAG TPA: glycosyl hydrolase [Opitutaceae bacterium]
MIRVDSTLTPRSLKSAAERLFQASAAKVRSLERTWNPKDGSPVFTVDGKYRSRGWTEWTQGFLYGSAILQFDATDDAKALSFGREGTLRRMASHVSHIGVHDHGFNNISTYGHLRRLAREGRYYAESSEIDFYELALKVSGAVQAARWTELPEGLGYIYSFNGPHSLFADTIRSLRVLGVAHQLGHVLMGERDRPVSLLGRLLTHAETTARFNVYFGEGRDRYDVKGRVAHESIFNVNDGSYRCPNSQQGYSPFTTWTRGLAWILCGYAEQLEFLAALPPSAFAAKSAKKSALERFQQVAIATADFYLRHTPTDGIPYWDTGAPGLAKLGDYLDRAADPYNDFEPVDSSAAAIAAQGLIRLGTFLVGSGRRAAGRRYVAAGLTVARTLLGEGYLSTSPDHQGLVLHAIYHRPNGWDQIHRGRKVPSGESCLWGDYHARELALMILRMAAGRPYPSFFQD